MIMKRFKDEGPESEPFNTLCKLIGYDDDTLVDVGAWTDEMGL
jgi:hypothetical protein